MTFLNHLGLCKGASGTLATVDSIRTEFDTEVKTWKHDICESLKPMRPKRSRRKLTYDDDDEWVTCDDTKTEGTSKYLHTASFYECIVVV